jgi:hypothetical protein
VGIRWLISDHSCFQARFRYIKQAICDSEDKLELFLSLDFECCLRARANRKADIISDPEHMSDGNPDVFASDLFWDDFDFSFDISNAVAQLVSRYFGFDFVLFDEENETNSEDLRWGSAVQLKVTLELFSFVNLYLPTSY